jgi:hypothetical protein
MSVSVEGQAMKLEELINKAGDMKVLPSVARKVMEMVEREDVSGSVQHDLQGTWRGLPRTT